MKSIVYLLFLFLNITMQVSWPEVTRYRDQRDASPDEIVITEFSFSHLQVYFDFTFWNLDVSHPGDIEGFIWIHNKTDNSLLAMTTNHANIYDITAYSANNWPSIYDVNYEYGMHGCLQGQSQKISLEGIFLWLLYSAEQFLSIMPLHVHTSNYGFSYGDVQILNTTITKISERDVYEYLETKANKTIQQYTLDNPTWKPDFRLKGIWTLRLDLLRAIINNPIHFTHITKAVLEQGKSEMNIPKIIQLMQRIQDQAIQEPEQLIYSEISEQFLISLIIKSLVIVVLSTLCIFICFVRKRIKGESKQR